MDPEIQRALIATVVLVLATSASFRIPIDSLGGASTRFEMTGPSYGHDGTLPWDAEPAVGVYEIHRHGLAARIGECVSPSDDATTDAPGSAPAPAPRRAARCGAIDGLDSGKGTVRVFIMPR